MKTVAIAATLALLAYTVSATPCTDICNGQCALQFQACDFAVVFGNLCATQNAICTQSCAAACGCADTCAEQCGGEFATCKSEGGQSVLNVLSCGVNLSMCASSCQTQCNFNLFAGMINSMGA